MERPEALGCEENALLLFWMVSTGAMTIIAILVFLLGAYHGHGAVLKHIISLCEKLQLW